VYAVLFQDQAQAEDMSMLPVQADSHLESCPAVSGAELCSPRSAGRAFAVTRSNTVVVTSQTVTDTTSVISLQPAMQLNSRVTLAELQPVQPAPVTADMSQDLKTSFTSPSATAMQTLDGSSRTTYGPMQISAQVLTLPRSITNCRNLSRPLTLCYAGRQVIVPPSCIVLGAEGAKLLLPPQTIVPNKPLPDPLDLSCNSTISSSSGLLHDQSTLLAPATPSKSRLASETAPCDRTDSLLPVSSEHKDETAIDRCPINTVPSPRSPSETHYSAESADQQVMSDKEEICAADLCKAVDISKLNDRCLVHIFSFLHLADLLRVRCVCSQWNAAANDSLLVNLT